MSIGERQQGITHNEQGFVSAVALAAQKLNKDTNVDVMHVSLINYRPPQ